MEPQELQVSRQPPRDAPGCCALLKEEVSDHRARGRCGFSLLAAQRTPFGLRRHQKGIFEHNLQVKLIDLTQILNN